MTLPETLDFSRLLAPIAGDNPAGIDLRQDPSPSSLYYRVKDARSAARDIERRALLNDEPGKPDWRPVLTLAPEVLTEKSKDLEMAAYLIEALVRERGFVGLCDGFRLVRELVEQFWDGLYPQPDEDGLVTRVAPLTGLNGDDSEGTLVPPIENIPITNGKEAGPFGFAHYKQASDLASLDPEKRERRLQQGAVSLDRFERSVAETPAEFFQNVLQDITACEQEYYKLTEALEAKCGSNAPPSSNIRNALSAIRETVQTVAKSKLPGESGGGTGEPAPAVAAAGGGGGGGPLKSRDDAFRTLTQVAEFFRRTEPHSPIPFALERVVRWGRMSLPELLQELIEEEHVRGQMFKLVGIQTPEKS